MKRKAHSPAAGDPIDAALMRAAVRRKLFDIDEQVTIGRFVVERRLGAGGMGIVFQAVDPELGRKVALKLLHVTGDETKLLAEARALARLRHANVVAVHDVGSWQGRVFVTMEYVPGGTLRAWLRERRRSWREVLDVLARAARGLAAAHRAGLVHRDVKPENVLVGDDGEVRVVDFGLARPQAAPASLDGTSTVGVGTLPAGTPPYLAPEVKGGAAVDARGDQYSFCVTLYEALYGARPTSAAAPPKSTGVPARIRRALARGLSPDPAARHPSMDALVAVLEREPGRMIRRAALVVAVAAAAAATAWVVAARRPADPCGGGASRLADVWSSSRRDGVGRAFDAAGAPYTASRDVVIARLDAYAAAWARGHRASCEATHVRRDQSPAVQDLRTRCLERRREALVATVDLLTGGDADTIEGAVRLVDSLPDLAACADVDALSRPVAPPDDARARGRLAELEARLAKQQALFAAGKFDRALEAVEALVADARALGHRPFLAEALVALGVSQSEQGKAVSLTTLREAFAEAQASGHDVAVARAAIYLGAAMRDHAAAHEWARIAAATLERLGSPPALTARNEAALGALLYVEDRNVEALLHMQAALVLSERAGDAETQRHVDYLNDLGVILVGLNMFDAGRARAEEALALGERVLGREHPALASMLTMLADVDERQGHWQAALARCDRALTILQAIGRGESGLAAVIIDTRGRVLGPLGRHEEAIAANRRALEIRRKNEPPDDPEILESANNLAVSLSRAGRHQEALDLHEQILATNRRTRGEEHRATALSLHNRGTELLFLGRAAEALVDCQRAAAIYARVLVAEDPDWALAQTCVGEAQLALGRHRAAIVTLERAARVLDAHGVYPEAAVEANQLLARARANAPK